MLQSAHAFINGAPGRENQHRSGATLSTAAGNQIETVAVRQAKVNDEGIMNAFQRNLLAGFGVRGNIHLVPRLNQCTFQEILDSLIIFYYQQSHRGIPPYPIRQHIPR